MDNLAVWFCLLVGLAIVADGRAMPTQNEELVEDYRERSDASNNDIDDNEVRQLDSIGGANLLRQLTPLGGSNIHMLRQSRRPGLDVLAGNGFGVSKRGGINVLNGDSMGTQKRNFDEIDRNGFNSFAKKNFDEIDRSGFDSFVKRNFDEIDRVGFSSFIKRSIPELLARYYETKQQRQQ